MYCLGCRRVGLCFIWAYFYHAYEVSLIKERHRYRSVLHCLEVEGRGGAIFSLVLIEFSMRIIFTHHLKPPHQLLLLEYRKLANDPPSNKPSTPYEDQDLDADQSLNLYYCSFDIMEKRSFNNRLFMQHLSENFICPLE